MSSTPTLFNSGTLRSQLELLSDHGGRRPGRHLRVDQGQRPAGQVRGRPGQRLDAGGALGSHIKGTNGKSQGVVPFLKVVNDTAVAVNQGGKRKGRCAPISKPGTWISSFSSCARTRAMTAAAPRHEHGQLDPGPVHETGDEGGEWTLFSPSDCPDLHDKVGKSESVYGLRGKGGQGRTQSVQEIPALQLWRKMLSMLFETGHPGSRSRTVQYPFAAVPRRCRAQFQLVHRNYAQYQRA
jgi:ribonucleoside-diphosphate reductase alpha chain